MTSLPDISIVMSVYNGADRLRETMESVLSQEGVSLEFIIVDDGSTDGSNVTLGNYERHDARVRILYQENQGLTRALIRACEAAKGKYIARQDAGDISLPFRLHLQKAVLDQYEDCAFVSCWSSVVGPRDEYLFMRKGKGRTSSPIRILSKKEDKWVVIEGPTHHGSVMFRREAYVKAGGYRAAFYYAQDWDLWLRLAALGTFATVGQCLYMSRVTLGSISSSSRDQQAAYARLSRKAIRLRLSGHSDAEVVEEAGRLLPRKPHAIRRSDQGRTIYFIGKCLVNNNDPRATRYFFKAISFNPFLFRAWWWAAISLARHRSNSILTGDGPVGMGQRETLLDKRFSQIVKESIPRNEIEPELRMLSATDEDVRHFRRIRLQQKRTQLDHWLDCGPGTRLRKTLARINRALGNPGRIWRAVQAAVLGTYRSGTAVAARHKIGIATQFLQIFAEVARSGILFEEYYLYQLYLPERWRSRTRQFPKDSGPAQRLLIELNRPPDCQLLDQKHLFAARCKEAGLPSVRLLAQFIDGHPDGKFEGLPATDLFSKPANQRWGNGAEAWRYDRGQDCFFNAATDQRFSGDALLDYLCDLSRSWPVILQKRLRNHAALSPLTNGALSTLRIVTCTTPFGSIDLLPPVIRMPAGRLVVDNFAHGGLAAPIDFATGKICGLAVKKDNRLGMISLDEHPDSGQEFKGFPIPMWSEAVDLARRAHETFPSLHFIGWDIAVLQDGPILVEGNVPAATDLPLLIHGLTLSDTQFIPYYNYHWANSVLANAATA